MQVDMLGRWGSGWEVGGQVGRWEEQYGVQVGGTVQGKAGECIITINN